MRAVSATSDGGSPGRGSVSRTGRADPVCAATSASTSRTDVARPVPQLNAPPGPAGIDDRDRGLRPPPERNEQADDTRAGGMAGERPVRRRKGRW